MRTLCIFAGVFIQVTMHNIKSILLGITIGLFILLGITLAVSYFYEDEVSQYLIEELNEYLLTEVEVEDVHFSLIKKFPNASVEFKNVLAYTKDGFYNTLGGFNTDTLFFARSIYVQVDLLDLINNEITVTDIHFDKGDIRLFVDHLGDPNYIFWDRNPADTSSKDFKIALREVKITDSDLLYYNHATKLLIQSNVNRIDFEGNFSSQNYLMKIKADQFIHTLTVENVEYIVNKRAKSKLELDIVDNLVHLKNGSLNLQNLHFNVNGKIEKSGNRKVDLLISGNNLNLKSFINNLPQGIQNEFPNIIGQKGTATVNLNISGENFQVNRPHLEALFLLHDAQLFDMERDIRLSHVNIDGQFTNGSENISGSSKILFKTFSAHLGQNVFEGSFVLENFDEPEIALDLASELYFDEIKEIFKIDTLDILSGYAKTKVKYNGSYSELRTFKFKDLFTQNYAVDISLKDAAVKLKNHPLVVNDISGNITIMRTLRTDSLFFVINNNDFLINGRISKLFEYFNEKEVFNINARVYSRKLNLDELAVLFKSEKAESSESYQFPEKIALQLRLNIENFEVGKFNATDIRGNLNYKPKMFSLHEISFNSMNGSVKAGGVIIQKFNNDFLVKTQSRLTQINMNKLFYAFNNFGQTFITNKNIEGSLTGDIYFSSEWSDKIDIFKNSVVSEGDIVIHNGELINFEPLLGLSRFINVDELKNVQFSTLKNRITIKDQQIVIPQMDIESSALNMTASGVHYFNSQYSYHVKMLLSDLLSAKMKRSKTKRQANENIEEDKDGRITLYLDISGDQENNKVKYDKEAARAERRANLKEERRELKQILNEEFGWFKKDSAINDNKEIPARQEEFQIEFEETKPEKKKKPTKESDQKFIIEWEEDTSNNLLQ